MSKWYNKVLEISDVIEFKDGWTELKIIIKDTNEDFKFYTDMCKEYTVIRYLYFTTDNKEYVYKHLFLLSVAKATNKRLVLSFHQNECDKKDKMDIIRYMKLNKLKLNIQ
jgi:hypothetical protein